MRAASRCSAFRSVGSASYTFESSPARCVLPEHRRSSWSSPLGRPSLRYSPSRGAPGRRARTRFAAGGGAGLIGERRAASRWRCNRTPDMGVAPRPSTDSLGGRRSSSSGRGAPQREARDPGPGPAVRIGGRVRTDMMAPATTGFVSAWTTRHCANPAERAAGVSGAVEPRPAAGREVVTFERSTPRLPATALSPTRPASPRRVTSQAGRPGLVTATVTRCRDRRRSRWTRGSRRVIIERDGNRSTAAPW